MPAIALLKIYFIGTAFYILAALYGMVDSVGGLMFFPTHFREKDLTLNDGTASRTRKETEKQG